MNPMVSLIFIHTAPVVFGFILDRIVGDPQGWPHPIRLIGRAITWCEKRIRPLANEDDRALHFWGAALAVCVAGLSFLLPFTLLWLAGLVHIGLRMLLETLFCYWILAAKCLQDESMAVYRHLAAGDVQAARSALSWIVGRDVQELDREQIAKAAVETVAENASDGVAAPLFYLCLGGAALGFCYKAISTMDSMIGYKNDRYLYFGRFAARLDDVANFIPARLCALLMLAAGSFRGLRPFCSVRRGLKIFLRDRYKHKSPNSAQTESACAGLLGIQLAGDAFYGGALVRKPFIGDEMRKAEPEDIARANRIMYAASISELIFFILIFQIAAKYLFHF
ncbi:MAG: adenosylcobinamide-phosphate synthase CbiB [Clostridiales bacterium]|jgi:adenosylcobinamide-phosphate synthase|nr:adenosylcobinamide-phosphate synthase CbiB [Clostridiales bacterium]